MNKLSALSFAALLVLGAFAQAASSAEDPHAVHTAPGGPPPGMGPGGMGGEHGGGMHEMMRQHMDMMREHGRQEHKSYADVVLQQAGALKLSDEQIGKITRIHQAAQQQVDTLGPKLHESQKATHDVYLNPAADEAAIRKAAKEHTALFDQFVDTTLKARGEINAVLTPDQLKQLQAVKVGP